MKFPRIGILDSVAAHLSAGLSSRVAHIGRATDLSEDDIGAAIARALCSDQKQAEADVEALTLSSVQLHGAHGTAIVPADEAGGHPLLAPWLRYNFGDLIGQVIRSGTIMANLTPGWPIFDRVSLVESEGAAVAATCRVLFRDPEAAADLYFGASPNTDRLLVHKTIGGDGLFNMGVALRESLVAYTAAVAVTDAIEAATKH